MTCPYCGEALEHASKRRSMLARAPFVGALLWLMAGCGGPPVTHTRFPTPPLPPPYESPAPPTAVEPLPVNASFGRTWDAVIDMFADRNTPIQVLDRASGLIVATPLRVAVGTREDSTYAASLADCGKTGLTVHLPRQATYNVVVRGDSARSTVKVNVRFVHPESDGPRPTPGGECATRGVWEHERAAEVRERAEAAGAAG